MKIPEHEQLEQYTEQELKSLGIDDTWPKNLLLWELVCLHELFRRMGFKPEEIFIAVAEDDLTSGVVLRTQGKEFKWAVGRSPIPHTELWEEWKKFAQSFNKGDFTDKLFSEMWPKSVAVRDGPAIAFAMLELGFTIPGYEEVKREDEYDSKRWGQA